jgi:protein dithiol:quinone oxidoreductase
MIVRYREIAWPWAAFLVALALVGQEYIARWLAGQPPLAVNAWRIFVMSLGIASFTLLVLPGRRAGFALGALLCAALMGYALYAQYGLGLEPCPLCIFQRIAVIACGVVFALGAIHNPGRVGAIVYAILGFLFAAAGAAVAGRHVWLQSLPPSEVPACGPGLNYMLETLPFTDVLSKVFVGSGECATTDWMVLSLSMPAWTLVFFIVIMVASIALIDRG